MEDIFRNNLSDLEQAYVWRINNLKELAANELPLIINHDENFTYNIETSRMKPRNGFSNVEFMVSYRYYLQKWDFARISQNDWTFKSNNRSTDSKETKASRENRLALAKTYLKDIDVERDLMRSTRSKTMLTTNKDDLEKLDPRQNAYFNLAFGWERSFYCYNEVTSRFHEIQVQEAMWRRLAN